MIHQIKIKKEYYNRAIEGLKPWELRLNDRDYQVNDIVCMQVIEKGLPIDKYLSGKITYILNSFNDALGNGWVIFTVDYNYNN